MSDNDDHNREQSEYKVGSGARRSNRGLSTTGKVVAAAALAVVTITAVYFIMAQSKHIKTGTSESAEFQTAQKGSGIGVISGGSEPNYQAQQFDTSELDKKNAELTDQIKKLQNELASAQEDASKKSAEQLKQLRDQMAQMVDASGKQQKLIESLQTSLQDQSAASARAQALAAEQAARDAARQKRLALLSKQIASDAVIYDGGQKSASGSNGRPVMNAGIPGSMGPDGNINGGSTGLQTQDQRRRAFTDAAATPVKTELASVIANPSHTVLQGTMIGASLLTAVDSSLPGNVSAIINNSVYSFDGSRVLIPSGSKAFGQYSSDINLGQKRVQIAWTRIVTPDGQAVSISSIGGDQLGRAGVTGQVDSHFLERFGGAALISLISAGPDLAAAALSKDSNSSGNSSNSYNQVAQNALQGTGQSLTNATQNVMADYINIPATISLPQGAAVTIALDRDIEIF